MRLPGTRKSNPTRLSALMILEWKAYKGYEDLLKELANDASPEVAFEANLKLRERGSDTATACGRISTPSDTPRPGLIASGGSEGSYHLRQNRMLA